ncbi:SCO2400 family protein [Streptomyces microflavus]|uniref:SCO2400 family protein n=1 Tax=Streptomyces microflavus TaxID=1919 RepID=UPI003F4E333D
MDYCHPCRRHLNGALACAGCGTPADALGPYAVPAPTPAGHAPDAPGEAADAPAPAGVRGAATADAAVRRCSRWAVWSSRRAR